jgi:hypothetical protein
MKSLNLYSKNKQLYNYFDLLIYFRLKNKILFILIYINLYEKYYINKIIIQKIIVIYR